MHSTSWFPSEKTIIHQAGHNGLSSGIRNCKTANRRIFTINNSRRTSRYASALYRPQCETRYNRIGGRCRCELEGCAKRRIDGGDGPVLVLPRIMCSLCPRKRINQRTVRFDSYVDTFSLSDVKVSLKECEWKERRKTIIWKGWNWFRRMSIYNVSYVKTFYVIIV